MQFMIMTIDDTASKMVKSGHFTYKTWESFLPVNYRNWLLPRVYNFSFQESSQLKFKIEL